MLTLSYIKIQTFHIDDLFEDLETGAKYAPVCVFFDGEQCDTGKPV